MGSYNFVLQIVLSYSLVVCIICTLPESSKREENNGCSAAKVAYGSKGFNQAEVPLKMTWGNNLKVCSQGLTCCTTEMEQKLERKSNDDFNKALGDKISQIRATFLSRHKKFDDFFVELLEASKKDLHDMFVRTYGLLYQQNAHVFATLFDDLRQYYRGSDLNLADVVDGFFTTLLQKLFVLLHQQSTFDDAYLHCMSENMEQLKPFGMIPQRLGAQVKRTFVAARTFVQALAVGRDVVFEVSKIEPTGACRTAVMKLQYCSYCRDLATVRPCSNYCMNVMRGCLANYADLNDEWNKYIEQLLKLQERLDGPFNTETVMDPIDVKISEAIMNFQENSEAVSSKVVEGCGQMKTQRASSRQKRQSQQYNDRQQGQGQSGSRSSTGRQTPSAAAAAPAPVGSTLSRMLMDMKQAVLLTKDFWKNLPHSICNDVAAPPLDDQNCWNGAGKAKYTPVVVGDGTASQASNPEVTVSSIQSHAVINNQILQLRLVTTKLKNAYNGLDVDSIDLGNNDEDFNDNEFSGSGSGYEGSGVGPPSPPLRRPSKESDTDQIVFSRPTYPPPTSSQAPARPPVRSDRRPLPPTNAVSSLHHYHHLSVNITILWVLLVTVVTSAVTLR